MSRISKIRVGVLRGGPSPEYEVSLKSGQAVLENLPPRYQPIDILIDQKGLWHWSGLPIKPADVLKHLDLVFNALHGQYGEDGKLQTFLDNHKIPYTGSGALSSALAFNKILTKKFFSEANLPSPRGFWLNKKNANFLKLFEVFEELGGHLVVKPANAGSSIGVSLVTTLNDLPQAVERAFEYSPLILIEEYVRGREATCGVIEGLGGRLYPLPPIEIRLKRSQFFDYQAKYGGAEEICPGNFSPAETDSLKKLSCAAHRVLGLRHYSRADFILGEDGKIRLLEINSLPGLTGQSLLPKALKASGCQLPEFIEHLATLALNGRR